jgi:opacity protein-like surface antigen
MKAVFRGKVNTMKNKLAALLCVAAGALTLSPTADATQVGKFYGRAAGGYIFSDNVTFDVSANIPGGGGTLEQRYNKSKTKGGFSGEVAFGYDFKASVNRFPVVRAEVALGYKNRKVDDKNTAYNQNPGAIVGTATTDAKIQSFTVMLNAYLDLIEYYRFVPYVGFGVGASFNKIGTLNTRLFVPGAPVGGAPEVRNGRTQGSLAWQLTLGTAYRVNTDWSADLYYRYSDLGKVQTQKIAGAASNNFATAKLNNHEVMVGVRYTF